MWRPEGTVIRDGGFRRAYSILDSMPGWTHVTLIDRHPSHVLVRESLRVVEYHLPSWHATTQGPVQRAAGYLEAFLAFTSLMWLGLKELHRQRDAIVYVPTSEIPWVTA